MDKKKSQTKRKARKGKNVSSLTKRFRHRGGVSLRTMLVEEVKNFHKKRYRTLSLARKTKRIADIVRKHTREKANRAARSLALRAAIRARVRGEDRMVSVV